MTTTETAAQGGEPLVMATVDDGYGNMVSRMVPASSVRPSKGRKSKPAPLRNIALDADVTDARLLTLIERLERLFEERKGINDDIRDVAAEAKAVGYDKKQVFQLIKLRAMDPQDRHEQEAILEAYKCAVGMA